MGLQQSKDEQLYQQANYGNIENVKALRSSGAGLEWIDREGKTPLILACTKPDGYPLARTLIELGANVNAYRPGYHAGTPLHHAAKKGLEPIVNLLLSHGANILRVNDDCQTALDLARAKGHLNVVRAIENHICLFSGWLRELSGPGFLQAFAPQWISRKIWAVVLPCDHRDPMNFSKLELVIYPGSQVAQPRAVVPLWKAQIEEINTNQNDPVVVIYDKGTKMRHKILSGNEGDKQQILLFYDACRGIPQLSMPPSASNLLTSAIPPSAPTSTAEGISHPHTTVPVSQDPNTGGWGDTVTSTFHGWGPPEGHKVPPQATNGWTSEPADNSHGGWAALGPLPGNSAHDEKMGEDVPQPAVSSLEQLPTTLTAPAAPPVSEPLATDGRICYPSVDLSPVDAGDSLGTGLTPQTNTMGKSNSISRTCVICLDAPAEAACVPCGHMAGCMSCLKEIKAKNWGCPVCRAKINQVVRLYSV